MRSEAGLATGDRGGFRVALEEEAVRAEAITGPVDIIGAGVEVHLDSGQGGRVYAGQAPTDPVALLGPGQPVHPLGGTVLFRPEFRWSSSPGAMGHHVEIAEDEAFSQLLMTRNVDSEVWAPPSLLLPFRVDALWWRGLVL